VLSVRQRLDIRGRRTVRVNTNDLSSFKNRDALKECTRAFASQCQTVFASPIPGQYVDRRLAGRVSLFGVYE